MANKVEGNTFAPIGAEKQQIRNKTGFPYKETGNDRTLDVTHPGGFGHSGKKCVFS